MAAKQARKTSRRKKNSRQSRSDNLKSIGEDQELIDEADDVMDSLEIESESELADDEDVFEDVNDVEVSLYQLINETFKLEDVDNDTLFL